MEIIVKIAEDNAFTTYILPIVTTCLGAILGGAVTLIANSRLEKKRIITELKIDIWNDISKEINAISSYIVEIETINTCTKDVHEELPKITKIYDEIIVSKIYNIKHIINKNLLIMKKYNYTDGVIDVYRRGLICLGYINAKIESDRDVVYTKKNIEKLMDDFSQAICDLSAELSNELLKDIMNKKAVRKNAKLMMNDKKD